MEVMSRITQTIDGVGRREAISLPAATTGRVFALAGNAPATRQEVNIANCDATAELYVAMTPSGATAPATLGASDHDFALPPHGYRSLPIGLGVDLWVRSSASGGIVYSAVELI
jgi:hypothetical protein